MQASIDDLQALEEIQSVDLAIVKYEKELEALPQRAVILDVRKKREVLEGKMSQIASLQKDVSKKLSRIEDEDSSLSKKEAGVQAAIEAAGDDFRNAEARSKELEGIAKRREVLSGDRAKAKAELEKVEALENQVNNALSELEKTESEAIGSFKREGSAINESIAKARSQRKELLSEIDPDVADIYDKTSKMFDTVFLGKLEGTRCGVCRATIEAGRLIQMKAEAPLSTCPSCKRLLIIEA